MSRGQFILRRGYIFLLLGFFFTVSYPALGKAASPSTLRDVWVVYQKGRWHVVLIGPESITYKATKVSDPPRVVVDLPNTLSKTTITSPIRQNEIIARVKTSTIVHDPKPLTRVEIGLKRDVSYNIVRKQEKIWISLSTASSISKAEPSRVEPVTEVQAEVPPSELVEVQAAYIPQPPVEEPAQISRKPLPPASKILTIEPVEMEENFDVHIVGDGRFNYYDVSLLNNPPRLVVDLLGVNSTEVKEVLTLNVPWVKKVRVGIHSVKVRVVFDLLFKPETEIPYQINSEENRLVVSFGPSSGLPTR